MVVGRQIQYFSRRGTIHYTPSDPEADNHSSVRFPEPPFRPRQVRPRSIHITRFPAGLVYIVPPSQPETLQDSRFRREIRKLASRENAKRVLGSVFSSLTSSSSSSSAAAAGSAPPSNTEPSNQAQQPLASLPAYYDFRQDTPSAEVQSARPARRDTAMPASQEARIAQGSDAVRSSASGSSRRKPPHTAAVVRPPNSVHIPEADRPVATATGVSCSILLDEPHIYLTGFEHDRNHHPNSTAMIRGTLLLDITKSTKIKTVTLTFSGKARTEWPEGELKSNTILYPLTCIFVNIQQAYPQQKLQTMKNSSSDSKCFHFSTQPLQIPMMVTGRNVLINFETRAPVSQLQV
jgi:hypothetical protein